MRPVLLAVLIVAFLVLVSGSRETAAFPDGYTIVLAVADTPEERAHGLMNRTIAENQGMLFIFERTDIYTFWMKNVPQSLDIIFLDENFTVVSIFVNVPPCFDESCPLFTPMVPAAYALEVRGGFSERHSVEVGSVLDIKI